MVKLDEAHKNFIEHLKSLGRSRSTVVAYEKDTAQLIDFLYKSGVNEVGGVEIIHLEGFMTNLADKDYTKKSISRKTNSTKTFFRFLMDAGHAIVNVADQLKHPKVETKAPRILSRLEYGALRDAAKEDVRTFAIVEVLLQTGIRISELANIKLEDIEFDETESGKSGSGAQIKGNLKIPELSSHKSREVPLNKAAVDAIKKYLAERPNIEKAKYLFITKTGNPLLVRNIRATITRFFKEAGIENAKVNDLRHTFVAHHLAHGANLLKVSKIAGHKRISTTERYLEHIERQTDEEKADLGVL